MRSDELPCDPCFVERGPDPLLHIVDALTAPFNHITGLSKEPRFLLPKFAEPELAVRWAWARFTDEADVLSGSAEERALAALTLWVMQRWNVTVRDREASRAGVREAEAWYDDDAVYIPAEALAAAAGGMLPQKALADLLDERGLIAKRDSDGRLSYRFGGRGSRLRVYALDRKTFGMSRADGQEPPPTPYSD